MRRPPERRLQTTDRLLITVDPGDHIRGAGQPTVVGEVVGKIGQLDLPRETIAGYLLDVLLVALVRPVRQGDHSGDDIVRKVRLPQPVGTHLRVLDHVMEQRCPDGG